MTDKHSDLHRVIAYEYNMSDVDDPDLYASINLWEWLQTDLGEWLNEASVLPLEQCRSTNSYGYTYQIKAWLKTRDFVFYKLKWQRNLKG